MQSRHAFCCDCLRSKGHPVNGKNIVTDSSGIMGNCNAAIERIMEGNKDFIPCYGFHRPCYRFLEFCSEDLRNCQLKTEIVLVINGLIVASILSGLCIFYFALNRRNMAILLAIIVLCIISVLLILALIIKVADDEK